MNGLVMWRATTANADGLQITQIPAGYKLYQLTVMADPLGAASFQIGGNPIIFVPANSIYTISGEDTPDYFDDLVTISVTLGVTPSATSQAQGVLMWGKPSSNRPLIRMAAEVCAFIANLRETRGMRRA